MNRKIQRLNWLLLCIFAIVFLLPFPAGAESARSRVESGNEAFSRGEYDAALENYEKAAENKPDSAIVLFNKGDALYKQEKFTEAFNVFEQAATKAMEHNDRELEAQSRYNMGNSTFRRAESLSRENPQLALDEYQRSSGYYQSAVELNPDLIEAAHNLEVSRIAARQIEEIIRQQQQEAQQQAQQKQEIARELESLQQEQQQAAEQSHDLSRSQEQQQSTGNNEAAQQAENQQSLTERTKQAGEKLDQLNQEQDSQSSEDMAREHVKRAVEKQQQAEKNLQQNNPAQANANQQEAAGELQKALEQLAQGQEAERPENSQAGEQESRQGEAEQQEQSSPQEETAENDSQAPPVAESYSGDSPEEIINEELENQKYRSARGATGYKPVDKDW